MSAFIESRRLAFDRAKDAPALIIASLDAHSYRWRMPCVFRHSSLRTNRHRRRSAQQL